MFRFSTVSAIFLLGISTIEVSSRIAPENKLYFPIGPIPQRPQSQPNFNLATLLQQGFGQGLSNPFQGLGNNFFNPGSSFPSFNRPSNQPAGTPSDVAKQRADALANGNSYRQKNHAEPLAVDQTLQNEAQQYAEYLASTGTFQHSNANGVYGENLARLPSPGTIAQANDAWYKTEEPLYCPRGGPVTPATGHFTQMVWKSSKTVGYGSAVGKDGYTYVVARYQPPGNYMGLEAANVSC